MSNPALMTTSSSIVRLPPELLLKIFVVYKQLVQGALVPSDWACDYSWIKITHICHHWREVALQSPSLWATIYIPTARPDLVDELALRSQSIPLSMLSFQLDRLPAAVVRRDILRFLGPRGSLQPIKRLQIQVHSGYTKSIPTPDCSPSAFSNLEELKLSSYGARAELEGFAQFIAKYCPAQLRLLSLNDCAWHAQLFHNTLTTLKLYNFNKGDVEWEEFCATLAPLTQLEHIHLHDVLRHLTPLTNNGPTFTFPRLQSLGLFGDRPEECSHFLLRSAYPSTCHFRGATDPYEREESLATMLDVLLRQKQPMSPYELILLVYLGWLDALAVELRLLSNAVRTFDGFFTLPHVVEPIMLNERITHVLKSIHSGTLYQLTLKFSSFTASAPLLSAIATLPMLNTLVIMEANGPPVLLSLQSIPLFSCSCLLDFKSGSLDSGQQELQTPSAAVNDDSICESCNFSLKTCFPSLRVLQCDGANHRGLDANELGVLKRLLLTCNLAEHRIIKLSLGNWDIPVEDLSAEMRELEALCDELLVV